MQQTRLFFVIISHGPVPKLSFFWTILEDLNLNFRNISYMHFLGVDHLTFEGGGGGLGDLWSARFFFSSNLVGRIFFYSSARIFFYYLCAACNFFLPTSACRKFFFKITHPLPQELNGRPLMLADIVLVKFGRKVRRIHK